MFDKFGWSVTISECWCVIERVGNEEVCRRAGIER